MNIVLANAAFGDDPRRWPLPPASTPHALWLRAVAAGGQGRYSSAMADLAEVCMLQRRGPLVSLAHSTRASFLRQLGWPAALGSARDAVKSVVILAAALCSAGEIDRSRMVADAALDAASRLGIIPLRWALACLLADLGSARHSATQILSIRNESAATV